MRFMNPRSALLTMLGLIGTASTFISVLSVAGRWECSGTGLEAETVNFRLELKQSGTDVSGVLIVGDDEIPIREGKVRGNEIELITFADDKQFTSVATVEGDEFRGTWKDDTGRSGKWQGKRLPAGPK